MALEDRIDDVLLHALGLDADRRTPWRNHFVAGLNHADRPALLEAERRGWAERPAGVRSSAPPTSEVWRATPAGTARARAVLTARHPPRKRTRSQARYARYREFFADFMTFGEFLRGRQDT
jgi:hypothetical protein